MIDSRRIYRRIKRRAQTKYMTQQKDNLHKLAVKQPNKFWKEMKRLKRSASHDDVNISPEEFLNHFRNVFSDSDEFSNDDVERLELINDTTNVDVDLLDSDISLNEVTRAISSLKRGKSGGCDNLLPEMFIECSNHLSPLLCRLFNHMYSNCIYPRSWTNGIIVPVPKKGDLNDVNNYRGITLSSIFAKIFSIILDSRLRKWSEDNDKLNPFQFGFRRSKSTTDCIFALTSIINKVVKNENKKLYCAFVDFRKAFDVVYRNGIFYKLLETGVSTKFVNIIRKMYENVRSSVRVNGNITESFESFKSVKQGEPLSPLLFLMFINDMYSALSEGTFDTFSVDDINLFLLLFADDTVLMSYSKNGLQKLLDNLYMYCTTWGISVNTEKTVVMVFKKGNRQENVEFVYNGTKLTVVSKFKYLGVVLSSNGCYFQTQKYLALQASRAMFSLNSLFEKIDLVITDKLKLFDAMVASILYYGSEVWGFHKGPAIEKIHIKFLKRLLNVRQQTSNLAVYGELGRLPLFVIRKTRILKYWFNVIKDPSSVCFKLFNQRDVFGNFVNVWSLNVKTLLDELGFSNLWDVGPISNIQLNLILQTVHDQYLQHWYSLVEDSPKLRTFKLYKNVFEYENYLDFVRNDKFRTALSRVRCAAHKLAIEEGRYNNTLVNARICLKCNMNCVENEYHFILICPFYRNLRNDIFPRYYCHWPTIHKFEYLLSCKSKSLTVKLAKYVYKATKLRNQLV